MISETVALVGPSGNGKNTIVALLERFYVPLSGTVSVDGEDVRGLNVKWLRQQIGLGFDTQVGERETQLSGGQKQRIAIARAIVKTLPILLLDEVTSALDTESEYIVQKSLDRLVAASRRTTLVIAHRLSTIRNADRIAVHSSGSIVEIGSHDELMAIASGHYRRLVESQSSLAGEREAFDSTPSKQAEITVNASTVDESTYVTYEAVEASEAAGPSTVMARVRQMASLEWSVMALGVIGAILNSAVFPAWGVMMAKITVLFFDYDKTEHEMIRDARYWLLGFVALGFVYEFLKLLQHYCFAVASEKLVGRVRLAAFSAMLHQNVGWFDMAENASGALLSRLSTDAATLQAMTSETLNRLVVNVTTLGIVFAVCFFFSWQMTLILLAVAPLLTMSSFLVNQSVANGDSTSKKNNDAGAAAGALLTNSIDSIRTVASLGLEKDLNAKYKQFLETSKQTDTRAGIIQGAAFGFSGAAFGFSLGMMLLVAALLFYVSSRWIADGTISFKDMFAVFSLSSFSIGSAAQGATDPQKAKQSAENIFPIPSRQPRQFELIIASARSR